MNAQARAPDSTVNWSLADRQSDAAAARQAGSLPAADLELLLGAVRRRLQVSALAAPLGDPLALVALDCVQALQLLQGLLEQQRRAAGGPPSCPRA
jgi:hypothetical protein